MRDFVVNDMGLAPVKFLETVEIYGAGTVAGFNLQKCRELYMKGKVIPWSQEQEDAEQRRLKGMNEEGRQIMAGDTGPAKPGMGAPGTQTGSNVEHLQNVSLIGADTGVVNNDASVSVKSVGDMRGIQADGGKAASAGDGEGDDGEADGSITLRNFDNTDDVVIPADWKTAHHSKTISIARNLTGEEDFNKESATAEITKALEAHKKAGDNGDSE